MIQYLRANLVLPLIELHQKRDIFSKVRILHSDYSSSRKVRDLRRQKQIHTILKVANQKVPYYRDLFRKIRFNPDTVLKDIKFLQELPFLTKDILREQGSRLLNEDLNLSDLHLRKTAGSTGPCTNIYYDQWALDWTSAVNQFVLSFTGRRPEQLEYYISSSSQPMSVKEKIKHWVVNRHSEQASSFNDETMKFLLEDLCKKKPFVLHGHPSSIYALSKFIEKTSRMKPSDLFAFESTGEILDSKKAATISKALGCKVFNRYGNAEFGVVAHSKEDSNKLEIIDYICLPEAISLGNGLDEIILTTTTNTAMPLIRYRTGDIGQLTIESEREYLINIQGRIHDLVELNGKTYSTHYIQDLLEHIGGVDEFQILIKKDGTKKISIVTNNLANPPLICESLKRKLEENIEINFTNFNGLKLSGWRDKFRYIIKE